MIPKRAGSAPSPLSELPALPPIPDAVPSGDVPAYTTQQTSEPVTPVTLTNGPAIILNSLSKFVKVTKNHLVPKDTFDSLVNKGLIVVYDDFAVVSNKGLIYLVDFGIVT
jgi:hypothetical protein